MHVAIIVSNQVIKLQLQTIFQSSPHPCVYHFYTNGNQFINNYKNQSLPDLVLLDIQMPLMNGFETAKWIKQFLPFVPILIASNIKNTDAHKYLHAIGVLGTLNTNASPADVVSVISQFNPPIKSLPSYMPALTLYGRFYSSVSKKANLLSQLTDREMQIFKLMCSSLSVHEIADSASISLRTYDNIRSSIYKKLHLSTRELVIFYGLSVGIVCID